MSPAALSRESRVLREGPKFVTVRMSRVRMPGVSEMRCRTISFWVRSPRRSRLAAGPVSSGSVNGDSPVSAASAAARRRSSATSSS